MSPLHTLHGCNYSLIWLDSTMPGKEWEARSVQAVFALAIPVCGFPSFQNLLVLSFVFIYLAGDWSRKLWIPDLNRRFWKEELSSLYWSWRAFSVGFTHLAGVSPRTSSCLKGVGLHTYSCFWRHSQCDFFFSKCLVRRCGFCLASKEQNNRPRSEGLACVHFGRWIIMACAKNKKTCVLF